jgi:hypothetical protein
VAVNPFKKVSLYGNEYIDAYRNKAMDGPHVYAIADSALREMKRGQSTNVSLSVYASIFFLHLAFIPNFFFIITKCFHHFR